MKRKKIVFALAVSAGLLLILGKVYVVLTPKFFSPPARQIKNLNTSRDPLATGFEFTKFVKGQKVFTVRAEKTYLRDKKMEQFGFCLGPFKVTSLEDVQLTFFENNQPISRLASKYAVMDLQKKDFVFTGSPALFTADKSALGAERISLNAAQNNLRAQGNCFLAARGESIVAKEIITDPLLKNFQVIH